MACNSCKKSPQEFVADKKENVTIASYIMRFVVFLIILIILIPLIIPILCYSLFKVIVLEQGLNIMPILRELTKKLIPNRDDEDEKPDFNDEYELVHANDIVQLSK